MSMSKGSKYIQFINYRVRVTIQDGRQLVGKYLSSDRHMNIVLGDCEEFRKLPPTKGSKSNNSNHNEEREERRTLGLLILRGEEVISMDIEGPPPPEDSRAKSMNATAMAGTGIGQAAGRGIQSATLQAQPGLAGPVGGVGGPAPSIMQPQISRLPIPASMNYPGAPVIRPPGQQMPGFPPQMPPPSQYPLGSRPAPGPYLLPAPQYTQRPGMSAPPPRPGMPPPPVHPLNQLQRPPYGALRPRMPTPPAHPPN